MQAEYLRRESIEVALLPPEKSRKDSKHFITRGHCSVCGSTKGFVTNYTHAVTRLHDDTLMPNWREHMACRGCGFASRVRGVLHAWLTRVRPDENARIYVTEQVTGLYAWLRQRYPNVIGSEYLGPDVQPGLIRQDGVRHEDVMNLSLGDSCVDAVMSLDVLEHVADHQKAFAEFYRVLAPGGSLIFTAPFSYTHLEHVLRAEVASDGQIIHHAEPEYHGNPIDPEGGVLCLRYFGWRVIDELRSVGFVRPVALEYWSPQQGYLGRGQFVLMARKPKSDA
jgi:SAM-dependent methyltransferase